MAANPAVKATSLSPYDDPQGARLKAVGTFINQLRDKAGIAYGNSETIAGHCLI